MRNLCTATSWSLLKLMSTESMMPSSHLFFCCPLLLLPSIFPRIRLFSNESALCVRWPKYWSFSFSISPSNEYSGLISLGLTGWISLQSKGLSRVFCNTTVWKYQFFGAQPSLWSNSQVRTWLVGKVALARWTFVGKVMSLLFNMLSRFVIAFLPRSKCLLISWLQSPSAVILEPKRIKSVTVSIVSPSICHEVMGPDATILVFWMLIFKPAFSLSSFTFIKKLFSSSFLSAIRWWHLHIWGYSFMSSNNVPLLKSESVSRSVMSDSLLTP